MLAGWLGPASYSFWSPISSCLSFLNYFICSSGGWKILHKERAEMDCATESHNERERMKDKEREFIAVTGAGCCIVGV